MKLVILRSLLLTLTCLGTTHLCFAETENANLEAGFVIRAQFTTNIIHKEPVDNVLVISDKRKSIYLFTEVKLFQGKVIRHTWEHDGKTVRINNFNVEGPRWRMFSKIIIPKGAYGKWSAVVSEADGKPLKVLIFEYVKHGEQEEIIQRTQY